MTFFTNGQNIKIMLWKIAPMVIFFCLFGAVMALQSIGTGQFTVLNSIANDASCFISVGMSSLKALESNFAFFCLAMTLISSFAFLGSGISSLAGFAVYLKTIFCTSILVKFRDRFDLLAFGAAFCFNWFSHSLFPYKRFRLEPNTRPVLVSGSSYYTGDINRVQ